MNERIRKLRKSLGLTLEKFGEAIGVSRAAMSNLENGNRNITPQMFKSICREYNVNEEWLRDGVGEMFCIPEAEDDTLHNLRERIIGAITVMNDDSIEKIWKYIQEEVKH